MDDITIPDALLGKDKDEVNIFFYLREKGPDQLKLKLVYAQNMICFMIRGVKEIIDGGQHYQMNNEQIGLVSSGNMLMTERVTLRQDFESLLMFFSNEFLADFLSKYEISLTKTSVDFTSVMNFPKDAYLSNFQHSMKLLERDFTKRAFRFAKMEEILLYLIEKHPLQIRAFIASSLSKSQSEIPRVIQNHKFKNLNLEELAFLCNMSLSTFKRKFQDLYNTSPKKYVISERMKKAEQLLQHKNRPSDIYHQIGYENLSSFSIEFKKYFGQSPKTYQLNLMN